MGDETVRVVAKTVLERAEDYKNSVEAVIKSYNKKLQETDDELHKILEQLDRQQILNKEAVFMIGKVNEEILQLEKDNIRLEQSIGGLQRELWVTRGKLEEVEQNRVKLEQKLRAEKSSNEEMEEKFREAFEKMAEIEELTRKVTKLEDENELYKGKLTVYEKEIEALVSGKSFSEQYKQYEELFTRYKGLEDRNAALEEKVLEKDKLIEPFRPHLEAYSVERQRIIEESADTKEEAELKYDKIIEHHTRKQHIEDIIKSKKKMDSVKRRLHITTFLIQIPDHNDNNSDNKTVK